MRQLLKTNYERKDGLLTQRGARPSAQRRRTPNRAGGTESPHLLAKIAKAKHPGDWAGAPRTWESF